MSQNLKIAPKGYQAKNVEVWRFPKKNISYSENEDMAHSPVRTELQNGCRIVLRVRMYCLEGSRMF